MVHIARSSPIPSSQKRSCMSTYVPRYPDCSVILIARGFFSPPEIDQAIYIDFASVLLSFHRQIFNKLILREHIGTKRENSDGNFETHHVRNFSHNCQRKLVDGFIYARRATDMYVYIVLYEITSDSKVLRLVSWNDFLHERYTF